MIRAPFRVLNINDIKPQKKKPWVPRNATPTMYGKQYKKATTKMKFRDKLLVLSWY